MNSAHQLAARIIRQGTRALAGYAASELLQTAPQAAAGFADDPFAHWQQWLAARLEELSTALALERPALFESQVQWGRTALEARRLSTESFRTALRILAGVLEKELPPAAAAPAAQYVEQALAAYDAQGPAEPAWRSAETPRARLATGYLLALLEGDRQRASSLVLDAARQGHPVADLYLEVLVPVQEEVGRLWLADELLIAEEHFATATTRRLMAQLALLAPPAPAHGKAVLTASVAGNQHDLGLQVVSDFFEMDGWRTIQLGADMPVGSILEALESFAVDLVALSVALSPHLQTLGETIAAIRRDAQGRNVKILAGGRALNAAPDLAVQLGADAYAGTVREAISLARTLVGLPAESALTAPRPA